MRSRENSVDDSHSVEKCDNRRRRSRSKKKRSPNKKKKEATYDGPSRYNSVDITISENNTYENDSKNYDPIFVDEGSSGNKFDNSGISSPKDGEENMFSF